MKQKRCPFLENICDMAVPKNDKNCYSNHYDNCRFYRDYLYKLNRYLKTKNGRTTG